jgi:hypothetical protein
MTVPPRSRAAQAPLFCIVTPVFDPALPSIRLLAAALRRQSCGDWAHVLVSNGPSPAIAAWAAGQASADARLRYLEAPEVPTPKARDVFCDLGRRRDLVLKTTDAQRYLLFDADLELLRDDVLERLAATHADGEPEVIVQQTQSRLHRLPRHPVFKPGRIDVSNYCVSRRLARAVAYPSDFNPFLGYANDFRYYHRLRRAARSWVELEGLAARIDGNSRYERLSTRTGRARPPATEAPL